MKTTYILLVIFLFSFCKPIQAQSDVGNSFDGLQSTLTNTFSDFADNADEGMRWYWLTVSDIRMWMNAHDEGIYETFKLEGGAPIGGYFESETDNSIYGEFDWDNKALKMHMTDTGQRSGFGIGDLPIAGKYEKTDHYQYTDKDGYWYVPYDNPNKARPKYIKFNAKKLAVGGLEEMLDISNDVFTSDLALKLIGLASAIDLKYRGLTTYDVNGIEYESPFFDIFGLFLEHGIQTNFELQKKLEEALKALLNEKKSQIVGFPVFIHWALMYSPDAIKAKYDVTTKKYDCNGLPNACTQLTVKSSGDDHGKFMKFDQYNRLIFIYAKKEGTVRYSYDKDVTVTIPEAMPMPSWFDGIRKGREERGAAERKEKRDDDIRKQKEKLERENARKEESLEYLKKELKKLELKKEQAVTKEERDKVQEEIDREKEPIKEAIKELEEQLKQASNEESYRIQERIDKLKKIIE